MTSHARKKLSSALTAARAARTRAYDAMRGHYADDRLARELEEAHRLTVEAERRIHRVLLEVRT